MIGNTLSRTALLVAAARAAHLIVDAEPRIFRDTLAAALLGRQAERQLTFHRIFPGHQPLAGTRVEATCRSRFTEDRLAEAVDRGVDQYVILGAGLDTFGYRSPLVERVRVFEVDHPATQGWKQQALATAKIAVPAGLTFVPVDFESQRLPDRLVAEGFDPTRPAFVSCLGVTQYLTRSAIAGTLADVGGFAAGTELAVEYVLPRHLIDRAGRSFVDSIMEEAATSHEPWLSPLTPEEIGELLHQHGFGTVRHVAQRDMIDQRLWDRRDALRPMGISVIAQATVGPVGPIGPPTGAAAG